MVSLPLALILLLLSFTNASVNFTTFKNCDILVLEFEFEENRVFDNVPVRRYHELESSINSESSMLLRNNWLRQKPPICQLVMFMFPTIITAAVHDWWSWLTICETKITFTDVCYLKNLYFIIVTRILFSSDTFIFFPNGYITVFEIVEHGNQSIVTVTQKTPCNSRLISKTTFGEITRNILDSALAYFFRYHCPVGWVLPNSHLSISTNGSQTFTGQVLKTRTYAKIIFDIVKIINLNNFSADWTAIRLHENFYDFIRIIPSTQYSSNQRLIFPRAGISFVTGEISYTFLTCDGASINLLSVNFLRAFQPLVWLFWLISISAMSIFLILNTRRTVDSFLHVVELMLEQNFTIPKISFSHPGLKIFFVISTTAMLTLCSAYKGLLASNVSAPTPVTGLKLITEALDNGYHILVPIYKDFLRRHILNYNQAFHTSSRYAPASKNIANLTFYILFNYVSENNFLGTLMSDQYLEQSDYIPRSNKTARLYQSLRVNTSLKYSAEKEFIQCKKTIMLDTNGPAIDKLFARISKYESKFQVYKGNDKYLTQPIIFMLHPMSWDRFNWIYNRLQRITHSGIFQKVIEFENSGLNQSSKTIYPATRQPIRMNSIIVIVIVATYAVLIIISCVAFIQESFTLITLGCKRSFKH